ncbi:hypothetical protein AMECASPLE_020038 [Ameca splendens]|uniref:Uncharacterized protein n=1 Tax=Ameca splendens TaxID=208324 RepID=A0ABV0ZBZ7_9TELE
MKVCGCNMAKCETVHMSKHKSKHMNTFAMHCVSFSFRSSKSVTYSSEETFHPLLGVFSESVFVPVEHVNKCGREGVWSQPPQIKNIHSLCVCVVVCIEK